MNFSQFRMAPASFAIQDYTSSNPLDYLSAGGGGIQTFGAIEQPSSQAATDQVADSTVASYADSDVDAGTVPQDADIEEASNQLPEIAVTGAQRPWLRRASLYKAVNYKGPFWLTGQENWVYLVVLALALGGAWWYFKRK